MGIVKRQERGERRRTQVLDATLRLLAKGGPRAVTHRAVAREADTSVRATTYYFSSRDELLTEALRHYADKAMARFDGLQIPIPSDEKVAIDAAAHLLALTIKSDLIDDRDGLMAEYELVLEIARNPTLEATYREWQAGLEDILVGYCELFGTAQPKNDARLVLAALRGLELEALSRPSGPPGVDEWTTLFRRLLGALYGSGVSGTETS